jgi:hypothetical protein
MHRLVPVNGVQRGLNRTKTEACCDALLDEAVILLNHVVQIPTPPAPASSAEFSVAFQFGDGVRVCLWPSRLITAWTNLDGQLEELGCDCIAFGRQQEMDCVARGIHSRYK